MAFARAVALDGGMLNLFRRKIMNPIYWNRAYTILHSYNGAQLRNPYYVGEMVDRMAYAMGVAVTPAQRAHAISWVCSQGLDPANPWDRMRVWRMVRG